YVLIIRVSPASTLFPYTTLFRSPGEPLGRIRMLISSKHDGVYDQSTVYADGFRWPSGILCWDGGVFVISNPDIWYLKDAKGDGRSEEHTSELQSRENLVCRLLLE